jgi:hypothetical protein
MPRSLELLLVILLLGCGTGPGPAEPGPVAPWLRMDRQRCLLHRDLSENMEAMARRCAERFVRENGYTELPPEDSTRWVREGEDGGEWARVLGSRAGTLDAEATTVQCSVSQCIVLFRVRKPMLLCAYRAVTMTQVFTKMQLAPGGIRDVRCAERRV